MLLRYVNQAFSVLTGYSQQEAIGQNCRFLQGELTEKEQVVLCVCRVQYCVDAVQYGVGAVLLICSAVLRIIMYAVWCMHN